MAAFDFIAYTPIHGARRTPPQVSSATQIPPLACRPFAQRNRCRRRDDSGCVRQRTDRVPLLGENAVDARGESPLVTSVCCGGECRSRPPMRFRHAPQPGTSVRCTSGRPAAEARDLQMARTSGISPCGGPKTDGQPRGNRRHFDVSVGGMLSGAGTASQVADGIVSGRRHLGRAGLEKRVTELWNQAGAGIGGRGNLVRCLRGHAAERPDDPAFTLLADDPSRRTTMTYAQLDRRARVIAACLQETCSANQRVVLAYPPGLEFIAAFFGTLYAGCVAVPTDQPRNRTLDRFRALVGDAGAPVALGTAAAIAQFKAMAGQPAVITWLATDELADAFADRWVEHDPALDSLAMIQYTSGSTSQPKGVMLSHANLVENTRAISDAFAIRSKTTGVFWLPPYHDMGLIGGVLAPVFAGTTIIVMSPATFLKNPFRWLDAISKSRATISGGPNFAYDICVRKITAEQRATLDLSSWSVAFIGAETVQPATLARFVEAFGPCGFSAASFYPCYGLAEATLMVTGPKAGAGAAVHAFRDDALAQNLVEPLPDDAPHARRLVGCGAPVGSLRLAIIDAETLAPVAPDRVGEVWVAGESVGQGYWGDARTTAATFHARRSDTDDGLFLRTGDLGFIHERQLYIAGRVDDLIIVRGLNHHPQDIEATARDSHPLLETGLGAAFAIDENGTQRLVLVHEVARDGSNDLAPVIDAVRAAVLEEHGLALDAVVLIRCGTIAKTSSGKVKRHASRIAFLADRFKPLALYRTQPAPAQTAQTAQTA
ncbi:MAG: fatty acyl-AMP ligase, partial [Betaproteobacteria bacterium]